MEYGGDAISAAGKIKKMVGGSGISTVFDMGNPILLRTNTRLLCLELVMTTAACNDAQEVFQ